VLVNIVLCLPTSVSELQQRLIRVYSRKTQIAQRTSSTVGFANRQSRLQIRFLIYLFFSPNRSNNHSSSKCKYSAHINIDRSAYKQTYFPELFAPTFSRRHPRPGCSAPRKVGLSSVRATCGLGRPGNTAIDTTSVPRGCPQKRSDFTYLTRGYTTPNMIHKKQSNYKYRRELTARAV